MAGGRPSKLTPEITAAICDHIEAGAYAKTAALAVGISEDTFYAWRKSSPEFSEAIKHAAAKAECASISMVRSGAQGWQGSAWYLERKMPEKWATDRRLKREQIAKLKAEVARLKAGDDAETGDVHVTVNITRPDKAPEASER